MAKVDSLLNRGVFQVNWETKGEEDKFHSVKCRNYPTARALAMSLVNAGVDREVTITVPDLEGAECALRTGMIVFAVVTRE